ncbi:MAG: hypothetical protein WCV67_09305 [Victivallaceae bacterium]
MKSNIRLLIMLFAGLFSNAAMMLSAQEITIDEQNRAFAEKWAAVASELERLNPGWKASENVEFFEQKNDRRNIISLRSRTTVITGIELIGEKLQDISPLCALPVQNLAFSNCKIANLAELGKTELENLWIIDSEAKTDSLKKLKIKGLYWDGKNFGDKDPALLPSTIETLYLKNTAVSNLNFKTDARIRRLYLAANAGLADYAVLKDFRQLNALTIKDQPQFKTINFLPALNQLEELALINTSVNSLDLLKGRTFNTLVIRNCPVLQLDVLGSLKINNLTIGEMDINTIPDLGNSGLESLTMVNMPVKTLDFIEGLQIKTLNLINTQIKDISIIHDMPVASLNIQGSPVEDISWLDGKTLDFLDLSHTPAGKKELPKTMKVKKLINIRTGPKINNF